MIDPERRRELAAERNVTLNDLPARISGTNKQFATVTQLDTRLGCEFAWETVDHIVRNRDGKFNS
jgi:hypothetical protein